MRFTVDIPTQIADLFGRLNSDVSSAIRESALIELYRRDQITHHELALTLGIDRFATDALLNKHGVHEDLATVEDHLSQVDHLRRLLDN